MGFRAFKEGSLDRFIGALAPSHTVEAAVAELRRGEIDLMPDFQLDDPDARTALLMQEACNPILLSSETGVYRNPQHVGAKYVNRNASGELMVVENGYWGNVDSVDDVMRVMMLAKQFPNHPIVMMDQLGHGRSSPFTELQRDQWHQASVDDVALRRTEALHGFLRDYRADRDDHTYTEIDISAGNITGMQKHQVMLEHGEIIPTSHVSIEVPGTVPMPTWKIQASYAGYETLIGVRLRSQPEADWFKVYMNRFRAAITEHGGFDPNAEVKSFYETDRTMFWHNMRRSVIASGIGSNLLEQTVMAGIPVARLATAESRIDDMYDAAEHQRWMESTMGQTYELLGVTAVSHEVTGFLPLNDSFFGAAARMHDQINQADQRPEIVYSDLHQIVDANIDRRTMLTDLEHA